MPEWGLTYFGILKAGANGRFPIDPASSIDEIIAFAKAGEASAIAISPKLFEENLDLAERLKDANLNIKVLSFDEIFEIQTEQEEARRNALLPPKILSNSVASLIFTSGTTGTPKAVMFVRNKNFVNMISMLSSVLDMDITDGVFVGFTDAPYV